DAALADADGALTYAREIGEAAALMYAIFPTGATYLNCGNYAAAATLAQELIALADEKGARLWKAAGLTLQTWVSTISDKATDALQANALIALRQTGATAFVPTTLSFLARAYAAMNHFDDAWRCIGDAIAAVETTKEKWWEAEVHRVAGEIALKSPVHDAS